MTKAKRRTHIPLKEQLAAALRQIADIPYGHARFMTADQVISLFHLDHGIFKTWEESPGEFDQHWNLTFRLIKPHREKTRGDVKIIRKVARGAVARKKHEAAMAAKGGYVISQEVLDQIGETFAKMQRASNPRKAFERARQKRKTPPRPPAKFRRKYNRKTKRFETVRIEP